MSFSTSTGALTGTPTSIAVATTYTVTATNASGSATATFDLTVLAPLSTDATLTTASTVKGQAVLLLGTPSATIAGATAGSVPISTTQAADISNSGSFITAFSKTNSDATIDRIVKYAFGSSYTGFATDPVYNGTAAITAGDFFIVKVVAVDESAILYYNIIAKFLPTFSAWANLSKPALAGDFVLTAPVVTGSLAGVFTYSSGTTGVITVSSATAHVVSSGTSVITATFTPTNTAAYSSANTTMTITVTTGDYTVGMDGPGGGKVFYVSTSTFLCGATLNTYCKFLESAPNGWNLGSDPQKIWAVTDWQTVTTAGLISDGSADNTSTGIGLGLKNSIAIVNQGNNSTTAAGLARAYAGGSLSDWYLPSTSELLQMCKWARAVAWTSDVTVCSGGTINLGTGNGMGAAGFTESRYWSSSQQGANTAWSQHFDTGGSQSAFSKATATYYVRPIRAFATTLPLFTLSSSSETRTVNIAATGFTVTSKGGAIVSFAIDAIPGGMSFNTTTGALTGTPNTVAGVTTYTVTATNSSGTSTATFALTVTFANGSVEYANGSTGPGGGKIFYYSAAGFNCGSEFTSTGSPTGGLCHYLEAAPSAWNTGTDPSRTFAQSSPVNYQSTLVNNPTSPQTATATEIGAGYSNTRAIILQGNSNTSTSAAALTDSYTVTIGGVVFDDWYLPSRLELTQLHSQRTVLTGFQSNNYWSSSAYNAQGVWIRDFSGTFEGGLDKSNTAIVRPIRAF
jgi:hypothetical protein